MNPNSSVSVRLDCGKGHTLHDLCVDIRRGVPPELRCNPGQPSGIARGGRGGCPIPGDLRDRVEAELRDNFQECKRQGFVLVRA